MGWPSSWGTSWSGNAFFGYYLYLLIMRQADIPHISVYILLLGPTVSPVKEMELAD